MLKIYKTTKSNKKILNNMDPQMIVSQISFVPCFNIKIFSSNIFYNDTYKFILINDVFFCLSNFLNINSLFQFFFAMQEIFVM